MVVLQTTGIIQSWLFKLSEMKQFNNKMFLPFVGLTHPAVILCSGFTTDCVVVDIDVALLCCVMS